MMASAHVPRVHYGEAEAFVLLVLEGRVHYLAARSLRALGQELVARLGERTLIIDVAGVEAIDSTGMGLLARLGRTTIEQGRRSVLVCPDNDVAVCLRSAAFDQLFVMLATSPLQEKSELHELRLDNEDAVPEALGLVMLEAHRDLSALSERNQQAFADVISLLEAQSTHPVAPIPRRS